MSLLKRKEAALSPSVRVNPIATWSHNRLYFPFLNTHHIVLPGVICDSRDHIISSLPISWAWHRAWHLRGTQKHLLLPLNFSPYYNFLIWKTKTKGQWWGSEFSNRLKSVARPDLTLARELCALGSGRVVGSPFLSEHRDVQAGVFCVGFYFFSNVHKEKTLPGTVFDSCRENCVLGVKSENVFNLFPLTF